MLTKGTQDAIFQTVMKSFEWDDDKNEKLKNERGLSFEEVVFYIANGYVLDIVPHPGKNKYPGQKMFIVNMDRGILNAYERGRFSSMPHLKKEVAKYREYAKSTLQKNKRINIRLSERDLVHIQRKAIEEGLPYQTLISSVLHKYISGNLTKKTS
jgi:hypothetical protein